MVGVTTTRGAAVKGHSLRKVENCCLEDSLMTDGMQSNDGETFEGSELTK